MSKPAAKNIEDVKRPMLPSSLSRPAVASVARPPDSKSLPSDSKSLPSSTSAVNVLKRALVGDASSASPSDDELSQLFAAYIDSKRSGSTGRSTGDEKWLLASVGNAVDASYFSAINPVGTAGSSGTLINYPALFAGTDPEATRIGDSIVNRRLKLRVRANWNIQNGTNVYNGGTMPFGGAGASSLGVVSYPIRCMVVRDILPPGGAITLLDTSTSLSPVQPGSVLWNGNGYAIGEQNATTAMHNPINVGSRFHILHDELITCELRPITAVAQAPAGAGPMSTALIGSACHDVDINLHNSITTFYGDDNNAPGILTNGIFLFFFSDCTTATPTAAATLITGPTVRYVYQYQFTDRATP